MASIADGRELLRIVRETRRLLALPGNDFLWCDWENEAQALAEIDSLLPALQANDPPALERMKVIFAPTGPLQEVSVTSGWSQEYLALAERFDRLVGD